MISQTVKFGVAVDNYKLPQLYINAEECCRWLIAFGAMSTSVSRAHIASVQARYSVRIGAAMRHATAQRMHGDGRVCNCAAHLRLMQLPCCDQSTRFIPLIAAGQLAARIKLR